VTMLLDAGAEIDADEINCYGGKPLHWRARTRRRLSACCWIAAPT
jgi:hypothetical protein